MLKHFLLKTLIFYRWLQYLTMWDNIAFTNIGEFRQAGHF